MSMKSNVFLNLIFMCKVMAIITVVDIGVLSLVENSVGITFFIDITNEDRHNICKLYSRCIKCCLNDSDTEDCNITIAYGDNIETIKPRDRKTLLYVTPMLFQHDLVGYCDFLLMYDYNYTKKEELVTIPIDTRVTVKKSRKVIQQYVGTKKIKLCGTLDENSLNNCEPVDCNIKYLDKKPIFNYSLNKCVEVPICLTNPDKELPDYIYIPNTNSCRNLDLPLTVQDIYAISTGLGTMTMPNEATFEMKVKVKSNCSSISQNLNFIRDLMYGNLCPTNNEVAVDYSECLKSALVSIGASIISICTILFILVCCVNYTAWFYVQWSDGNLSELWKAYKNPFKGNKIKKSKRDKINSTIRNALLREVVVRDLPLDLRNSVNDVCDRVEREVERKKRYRASDVGSQISLQRSRDSLSSSTSLEKDKN